MDRGPQLLAHGSRSGQQLPSSREAAGRGGVMGGWRRDGHGKRPQGCPRRSHSGLAQLQWAELVHLGLCEDGYGEGIVNWGRERAQTTGLGPLVPTEGPTGLQLEWTVRA